MRALALFLLLACQAPPEPVRFVADPTLADIAISYPAASEIRFNPLFAARLDPNFLSFLLLHEQGHLTLRHRPDTVQATRRRQELAADCWASARADRAWRETAIGYFEAIGPYVLSPYHPTGYARAAAIERCGAERRR